METTIYRNINGAEITESQAHVIGDFYIETIINGVTKITESYIQNVQTRFTYYLSSNESLTDLIAQYSSKTVSVTFVRELYSQNGYKVFELLTYKQGQLGDKIKTVEDPNKNPIFTQWIDIVTNLPIDTVKSYFDQNGRLRYEFSYDNNGTLESIWDTSEIYGSPYSGSDLAELYFDWTGLEYFQAAEPIIPGVIT